MSLTIRNRLPMIGVLLLALAGCADLSVPLPRAAERPTPLSFGLHVTADPANNPIDPPERFSGYHVGTDFEITKGELESDVPVYAVCSGTVAYSGFAEGYGGLVVQRCTLNKEPVTVLYGHLTVDGLPPVKSDLDAGDQIGILAPARSHDSDGNRKHLHLGIHHGEVLDERGYVQTEEEIEEFIDPLSLLPLRLSGTGGLLTPYWR